MAALTAAVALIISGCSTASDDPDPTADTATATTQPTPSVSPSADPTPSPTPAPTLRPVPPEAMELSEAGALAFLDWWVEMYNYVEATGETDLVFEHSEPGCTFCQNTVEDVDSMYGSGGRIERIDGTLFKNASPSHINTRKFLVIDVEIMSGPSRRYTANGSLDGSSPGNSAPIPARVGLQWNGDVWLLVDVGPGT